MSTRRSIHPAANRAALGYGLSRAKAIAAWGGTQVVSASWIDAATTPQINGLGSDLYGYFFWVGRSLVDRREIRWVAAAGLGGQRVFIVPELDLVVVMNAGLYQSPMQGLVPIKAFNEYVLKAASRQSR